MSCSEQANRDRANDEFGLQRPSPLEAAIAITMTAHTMPLNNSGIHQFIHQMYVAGCRFASSRVAG